MSFYLKLFAFAAALIGLLAVGSAGADDLKVALIYGRTGPLEAYAKQTETGLQLGLEYATKGSMEVGRPQDRHHRQGRPGQAGSRQNRADRGL